MTAPNKQLYINSPASKRTLDGAIDNSQTTIVVDDGSVLPNTGDFTLLIGNSELVKEAVLVTARSGDSLTVIRGQEGMTPLAHGNATQANAVISAGNLNRWATDNDVLWGSDRPALGKVVNDAGDTALVAADFTSVNASGVTFSDQFGGTILMRKPGHAGESVTGKVRTAPGTPYSYIAGFRVNMPCDSSGAVPWIALGFRKNSTGQFFAIALNSTTATPAMISVQKFTNPTTFSSAPIERGGWTITSEVIWFKIEDDGTSLKFYCSDCGFEWIQIFSEGRTVFMSGGPDEVGFFANDFNNNFEMLARLVHWSRAS
jgi:hypothetical protein